MFLNSIRTNDLILNTVFVSSVPQFVLDKRLALLFLALHYQH